MDTTQGGVLDGAVAALAFDSCGDLWVATALCLNVLSAANGTVSRIAGLQGAWAGLASLGRPATTAHWEGSGFHLCLRGQRDCVPGVLPRRGGDSCRHRAGLWSCAPQRTYGTVPCVSPPPIFFAVLPNGPTSHAALPLFVRGCMFLQACP